MGYGYLTLVRKYSQRIQTYSKRFSRIKCKQKQLRNSLLKLICTSDQRTYGPVNAHLISFFCNFLFSSDNGIHST